MKIGLLTYHYSDSYGATLQTYATIVALMKLGHEVEIIDLRLEKKESLLHKVIFWKRNTAFKKLWQKIYPKVSVNYPSHEVLKAASIKYDWIIVGSDQTWNPRISGNNVFAYFLDFGGENIKRLSYASSFGFSSWNTHYENLAPKIKLLLHSFDAVSVREKTGKDILKNKFDIDSEVVLDPTLLLEQEDYMKITGKIKQTDNFVTFLMHRSDSQLQKVLELGRVLGKKPNMMSSIFPFKGYTYNYPPSVENWLKKIGGAKFVVTDSFHGLVFSILYKKTFIVITPDIGLNSRIVDLLETIGLSERYFLDTDDIPYEKIISSPIDYTEVYNKLENEKGNSWSFLVNNLN